MSVEKFLRVCLCAVKIPGQQIQKNKEEKQKEAKSLGSDFLTPWHFPQSSMVHDFSPIVTCLALVFFLFFVINVFR